MSSDIPDPIALLPYQTGLIVTPLQETAAVGQDTLDSKQRAIVIGEPVPIVFCRRIDNIGGVFVSPGATEGRYTNDATTNELTVKLQLVLSEGDIPQLQLRDVFQRACRIGTWQQSYNARTESWTPGNLTTVVAGTSPWDCPAFCGTGGSYADMTTLSYTNTHADGDDTWDKQVHCFVREGIEVTRILDNTLGPSNNLIDLTLYLIRRSSRFPESMLDLVEMENAAKFTNVNGLYYNGIFTESTNLQEWMEQISTHFLLRITDKNGKKAFKSRLPVTATGAISTAAVSWIYTFSEEDVLPDGFEIEYISLAERKPICAQMIWRQQPDDDIGLIRTTEVRITDQATDGPYEQYDLSQFCTSELHAVKVGAYYVARRRYIKHNLRLRVRSGVFNNTLALGSIVRVLLRRETDASTIGLHDYLYEVERINRNIDGVVELDLTHFPVNSLGQSILALVVNQATAPGYVLPTGRGTFTCDAAGRAGNTTRLTSSPYTNPGLPSPSNLRYNVPNAPSVTPPGGAPDPLTEAPPNPIYGPSNPTRPNNNPSDPLESDAPGAAAPPNLITGGSGPNGRPRVGDTLTAHPVCSGEVCWSKIDKNTGKEYDIVCQNAVIPVGASLSITTNELDYYITAVGRCLDPASPTGYGAPRSLGVTAAVEPRNTNVYENVIKFGGLPSDTDLFYSFGGPAVIVPAGNCGNCVGDTGPCSAAYPRPRWRISNYYDLITTCTGTLGPSFPYKDPAAIASCGATWTPIDFPVVLSSTVYRTDNCP